MGICTSVPQRKTVRTLPLVFHEETGKQKLNNAIEHQFYFDLSNVVIFSTSEKDIKIKFLVKDMLDYEFHKENVTVTEMQPSKASGEKCPKLYQISWNQGTKVHFTSTLKELNQQFLIVQLANRNKTIEAIKINLYMIVHGPYHHNIELPFEKDHIRLLFDAKVSNIFQAKIQVKEFKLKAYQLPNLPLAHITINELIDEQVQASSYPSYNVKLPHSSILLNQDMGGYFQEERPNINRHKKNNIIANIGQASMEMKLAWAESETQVMPSLTVDISTQEIIHHSLEFMVWGFNENDQKAEYIFQSKIPLWKILEKKSDDKNMRIESRDGTSNIQIQDRTIQITQKLYCHHNVVGTCEILLHMKNQKMIEQIKYCTRTQDGILNLAPSAMNGASSFPLTKDIKSNNKSLQVLWKTINDIEQKLNANDQFLMLAIHQKLIEINEKVIQSKKQIYTDANKVETLVNSQNILLTIIEKLVPFIENNENQTFSSLSWNIIFNVLEMNEFGLENLCLTGIYTSSEAKVNLSKKKEVSKKYLTLLYNLIKYALKTYVSTTNMSQGCMKFLILCFFRVKSFRDEFFSVIDFSIEDDEIQRRLTQYQCQIEPKTSFNDSFIKKKTNWSQLFYKEIQNQSDVKKIEEQLRGVLKNKKWFMEISFKDELFYTFCCFYFQKIGQMNLGGSQKWKHIDGYSQLVIVILSQIKRKEAKDYSSGLIRTALSLLGNQYLINLLMPLICEKTNIHDFENVQIILDILNECLDSLTKKKKCPLSTSFNHNYFFTIIKAIMGGEHFYSINRILIIIYDYFNLFSEYSRHQVSMYLLGNPFFKLYYHWSKDIRYTFYNILMIRIQYIKHRKADQILNRYHKALEIVAIIQRLYEKRVSGVPATEQNMLKKLRMKVYQKRKKMPDSTTLCSRNQFQLERLERIWQQENDFDYKIRTANDLEHSGQERVPSCITHFQSEQHIFTPQKKKRTYSETIQENEESVKGSPSKEEDSEAFNHILRRSVSSNNPTESKTDDKPRRKRKPSFFMNSITESTKQYTSTITNQLHHFSELTNQEMKNIKKAKAQFKEVNEEITKHVTKHGVCPERNFSEINRKQIQG